jgi:hypothetical protein
MTQNSIMQKITLSPPSSPSLLKGEGWVGGGFSWFEGPLWAFVANFGFKNCPLKERLEKLKDTLSASKILRLTHLLSVS